MPPLKEMATEQANNQCFSNLTACDSLEMVKCKFLFSSSGLEPKILQLEGWLRRSEMVLIPFVLQDSIWCLSQRGKPKKSQQGVRHRCSGVSFLRGTPRPYHWHCEEVPMQWVISGVAGFYSIRGVSVVMCYVMSICFLVHKALVAHFTRRKGAGCSQGKAKKLMPLKWEGR